MWKKHGLIFEPSKQDVPWLCSHAWVPTVDTSGSGNPRVYFAGRNTENLSQVGVFTLDPGAQCPVSEFGAQPLLTLGDLGHFDDSAVVPCCVVNHEGLLYLYYVGWNQGGRVPYYATLGLAISKDGGHRFDKISRAPILDRNDVDPFFIASAFVRVEAGVWRMWYTSNTAWSYRDGQLLPRYHIRYAESANGVHWDRKGLVAIDFASTDEYAISRPWVVHEGGLYKMWYSHRGPAYRIGYAESGDGISWHRRDHEAGIDVAKEGFDSEMIEYAAVFDHQDRRWMIYNGNQFGRDGIGLASLA